MTNKRFPLLPRVGIKAQTKHFSASGRNSSAGAFQPSDFLGRVLSRQPIIQLLLGKERQIGTLGQVLAE